MRVFLRAVVAFLILGIADSAAAEGSACGRNIALFTGNPDGLLWRTDGTTSGTSVIPVNGISNDFAPGYFTQLGKSVFFGSYSLRNKKGLWRTDGTTAGTTEIAVNNSNAKGVEPSEFVLFKGKLLFKGTNASGQRGLWETDGSTAGTREIPVAGAASTGLFERTASNFGKVNGKLIFEGQNRSGDYGLWQTDGTSAGTVEIPVPGVTSGNLNPLYFAPLNGKLLFAGWDRPNSFADLWQTDGTSGGTIKIPVNNGDPKGVAPSGLTPLNGKLIFQGRNASGNSGLWETDGTSAGTREIRVNGANSDFEPGAIDGGRGFAVLNGDSVFSGKNAAGKWSMWRTDGTPAGTVEIPVPAPYEFRAGWFTPLNSYLVFAGDNGTNAGAGLWRTDGTLAGTAHIPVTVPGAPGGLTSVFNLASVHFGGC